MGSGNPTIRTVTLHVAINQDYWGTPLLHDTLGQAHYTLNALVNKFEQKGFPVWSKRITLTPPPTGVDVGRLLEVRDMVPRDTFVSIGGFSSGDSRVRELDQIISSNLFTYIAVTKDNHLEELALTLMKWSLDKPSIMVRLGVEFLGKKDFMTPYFPISATPETARNSRYTVALLYPNWIMSRMETPTIDQFDESVADAVARINRAAENLVPGVVDFAGIDTSLSPWMKDSVARLLELVGRCRLGTYDCIPALAQVNNVLLTRGTVGFNEVMLPLGEDDILKERASQGKLALEDLVMLLPFCLAGLDMVALTLNATELLSLLRTLRTVALLKKRVMGFRAILLPPDYPDEGIELERFGLVPVLKKREELNPPENGEKTGGVGQLIIP